MSETPSTITAALRQAADLLDANPGLPDTYITAGSWGVEVNFQLTLATSDLAEQKSLAAGIVRTLGGQWDKEDLDRTFLYQRKLSPLLKFRISVQRDAVCERVVVGTEQVTIPAQPAAEAQPERVEEREIVEWRCQPLLAETSVGALQHESHDLSAVDA